MSKLTTSTPGEAPGNVDQPQNEKQHVCQPPVVITTREVALSTAAAVGVPRRSLIRRIVAVFLRSTQKPRSTPRHYPPLRAEFLEDAAMQREMGRL